MSKTSLQDLLSLMRRFRLIINNKINNRKAINKKNGNTRYAASNDGI
jgi:2-iminoacetate synthase ThiH